MGTMSETNDPQMGLTFEKVWAALLKSREDFDRGMRESREEFDRRMRETDRQIGRLGRKFGSVVEHLVAPNLVEKFNALGFVFTKYGLDIAISDKTRKLATEIDVFLENGDCAIAVEVKAQPKIDDIKEHVERMETLRRYADAHQDARKFYGAVAGAVVHDNVKEYALKTGFYVISQSGDTMNIDVPKDFGARVW